MTPEMLTSLMAKRVMGWTEWADRFLMGDRRWTPRWRFQPTEKLEDAFRLLEEAAPEEYSICGDAEGSIHVRVRIAGIQGEAHGTSKPRAITCAIARALGIDVEGVEANAV